MEKLHLPVQIMNIIVGDKCCNSDRKKKTKNTAAAFSEPLVKKKKTPFEEDKPVTDQRSPPGHMTSPADPSLQGCKFTNGNLRSDTHTRTSPSGCSLVAAVTEDQNNPACSAGRHHNISGFGV